jgi:signal transduction histidine kinase
MRRRLFKLSRQYQSALQKYLSKQSSADLHMARELGRRSVALGLETLDLALVHEQTLVTLVVGCSVGARDRLIKRAGGFFAEAITPIEDTHRAALEASVRLGLLNRALLHRSADLATSNRELKGEIVGRKRVEGALRKSERHYVRLLEQSRHMQEQMRSLSRQLLSAQEEERKKISRELHDEIAQTLSGINVQLATLKREATVNVKGLQKKIAFAQRMVEKSVAIVHRFARELRPPVLDDLGLIPALHSFVKHFANRTGVRVRLTVFAGIKQLDSPRSTVLYRVAQESLINVSRHARATRVDVSIRKLPGAVCMEIKDNGKSFSVQRLLNMKGNNHLGLLGMRERVEMVGGRFSVESVKGRGTTIRAQIPFRNRKSR